MKHALALIAPLAALLTAAGLLVPAAVQAQPNAPYTWVETGRTFDNLYIALEAIGDRTGTLRFAPGRVKDCVAQITGNVTFVAAIPGKTVFDGKLCEGKAALVLRGRSARVEGLVFANMRTLDGNGAGIRLEKGNLTVVNSWFRDSEEGILAGNDPKSSVVIDHSTFTHLGRCDRDIPCAHSIYINFFDRVTITNSRFTDGDGGHYIKTRSRLVDIRNNMIDDTNGRRSNYLIDLPAGSTGQITGNWMVQGSHKENGSTIIAVAAESRDHPSDGLVITGNTVKLAPGASRGAALVRDWSRGRLAIGANALDAGIVRFAQQ